MRLARSDLSENQAFRYGDRWWGLQSTSEVDAPLFAGWMQNYADAPARVGLDREELESAIAAGLGGPSPSLRVRVLRGSAPTLARRRAHGSDLGAAARRGFLAASGLLRRRLLGGGREAGLERGHEVVDARGRLGRRACSTISRPAALRCDQREHRSR